LQKQQDGDEAICSHRVIFSEKPAST
jgi:hypothetical protein